MESNNEGHAGVLQYAPLQKLRRANLGRYIEPHEWKLEARAKYEDVKHFVKEWWDEYAYRERIVNWKNLAGDFRCIYIDVFT